MPARIPHKVVEAASAPPTWCWCRPAPGTGVIAGSAVRAVCEAAGIHEHPHQELRLEQSGQPGQGRPSAPCSNCARGTTSNGCEESPCHEPATTSIAASRRTRSASASAAAPARATARPAAAATRARAQLAGWSAPGDLRRGRLAADPPHSQARLPQPLGRRSWRSVNVGELDTAFDAGEEVTPDSAQGRKTWPRGATTC